jgi:hypothetical protein
MSIQATIVGYEHGISGRELSGSVCSGNFSGRMADNGVKCNAQTPQEVNLRDLNGSAQRLGYGSHTNSRGNSFSHYLVLETPRWWVCTLLQYFVERHDGVSVHIAREKELLGHGRPLGTLACEDAQNLERSISGARASTKVRGVLEEC